MSVVVAVDCSNAIDTLSTSSSRVCETSGISPVSVNHPLMELCAVFHSLFHTSPGVCSVRCHSDRVLFSGGQSSRYRAVRVVWLVVVCRCESLASCCGMCVSVGCNLTISIVCVDRSKGSRARSQVLHCFLYGDWAMAETRQRGRLLGE